MTAIILAGGKSSRFGRDKAFVKIEGVPIIKRQIKSLAKVVKKIIIVTNSPHKYRFKDVRVIRDIIKDKGPLGGIYSGLKASGSFYNFVVACDMPFLNLDLIRYLRKKTSNYDAAVIRFNNKLHPLYAVYTKNCLEETGIMIRRNSLRLSGLLRNVKTKIISERETKRFDMQGSCLTNLNTIEEYQSLYA